MPGISKCPSRFSNDLECLLDVSACRAKVCNTGTQSKLSVNRGAGKIGTPSTLHRIHDFLVELIEFAFAFVVRLWPTGRTRPHLCRDITKTANAQLRPR